MTSPSYPNNSGTATVVPRPAFIDARDYGAKFDYTTDDTAAIQAALNASPVLRSGVTGNDLQASIVQLPPGMAVLSGPLQIPANTWLRGHGQSGTYLQQRSTTSDTLNNKPSSLQVTISDLAIVQNGTPTAGAGIDLSNTGGPSILGDSRNIVRDVVIVGTWKGLHNLGGSEGRAERVTVQRPVNIGIQPVATDFFISDCTVGQPGDTGFHLNGANGRIWGCKVFGGGTGGATKGFWLAGSGRHELACCEVQDFNGDAYYIGAGSCALTACASDSCSGVGFNLDGSVGVTSIGASTVYNRGATYRHQFAVRAFGVVGSQVQVAVGPGIKALLTGGGTGTLSDFSLGNERGAQVVNYAATIAPDPYAGGSVYVGTLTGNIAVNGFNVVPNAPGERFHPGQRLAFLFTQDATGGRTVAFDSTFKTAAAIGSAANSSTRIEFEWTGSVWREASRTTI